MLTPTGLAELQYAVRATLLEHAALSPEGVFFGVATREEDLPYVLNNLIYMGTIRTLDGRDACRMWRLQAKVCVSDESSPLATAGPLLTGIYEQLGALEASRDRLNTYLNPEGWRAMMPLEVGDITPYFDYIGRNKDVVRWNYGHIFDLRIEKL